MMITGQSRIFLVSSCDPPEVAFGWQWHLVSNSQYWPLQVLESHAEVTISDYQSDRKLHSRSECSFQTLLWNMLKPIYASRGITVLTWPRRDPWRLPRRDSFAKQLREVSRHGDMHNQIHRWCRTLAYIVLYFRITIF